MIIKYKKRRSMRKIAANPVATPRWITCHAQYLDYSLVMDRIKRFLDVQLQKRRFSPALSPEVGIFPPEGWRARVTPIRSVVSLYRAAF
jgi:hypothetical protein